MWNTSITLIIFGLLYSNVFLYLYFVMFTSDLFWAAGDDIGYEPLYSTGGEHSEYSFCFLSASLAVEESDWMLSSFISFVYTVKRGGWECNVKLCLSHEDVPRSNLHLKYVKSREALFFSSSRI